MKKIPARKKPQVKPIGKTRNSSVVPMPDDQPPKPKDPILTKDFSLCDLPPEILNRVWNDSDREEALKRLTRLPAPQHKTPVPIPREEWDFSSLRTSTEEQREMCLKYELSREVKLWRQMAYNFRVNIAHENEDEMRISYFMLRAHFPCLDLAPHFPEWPDMPWLALDQELREDSLETRFWPSLRADSTFPLVTYPPYQTKRHAKDILYANFQIDLTESDKTIKDDFSDWLNYFRKQTGVKSVEHRGGRSPTDVLRSLGATRLLNAMNGDWKEAANIFDDKGNKYQDKSAWDKARDRTNEDIQKFSRDFWGDISSIIGPSKSRHSGT
jgi:hypothetical protein